MVQSPLVAPIAKPLNPAPYCRCSCISWMSGCLILQRPTIYLTIFNHALETCFEGHISLVPNKRVIDIRSFFETTLYTYIYIYIYNYLFWWRILSLDLHSRRPNVGCILTWHGYEQRNDRWVTALLPGCPDGSILICEGCGDFWFSSEILGEILLLEELLANHLGCIKPVNRSG